MMSTEGRRGGFVFTLVGLLERHYGLDPFTLLRVDGTH